MNEQTPCEFDERIRRLEKTAVRQHIYIWILLTGAIVLATQWFLRLRVPNMFETAGLLILDDDGTTRLSASYSFPDAVGLFLHNRNRVPRIAVKVLGESPSLHLYDAQTDTRLNLFIDENRNAGIQIGDEHGQPRIAADVDAGGRPRFMMIDAEHRMRALLTLSEQGSPSLAFLDENGKTTWSAP